MKLNNKQLNIIANIAYIILFVTLVIMEIHLIIAINEL